MIRLTLPVPPSTNRLWRHGKGRTYKDKKAVSYEHAVALICRAKKVVPFTGPVRATYTLYRARRRGDIDNVKVLWDSLEGFCFKDDGQIVELHGYLVDGQKPARVEVTIEAVSP